MKVEITDDYHFRLDDVFVPVSIKNKMGDTVSFCQRDDEIEITFRGKTYRTSFTTGLIEGLG